MRSDARTIFEAALQAVAADRAVLTHCKRQGESLELGSRRFDLTAVKRVMVIGAGKATASMAQAMESIIGDRIADGLICVKYGHGLALKYIRTIEAGHPLPDVNGMQAAAQILNMVQSARADDLIIFLLSGGGSALLPLPAAGIDLQDKQTLTEVLLACGATIHEINALRKHVSAIKGGRLAWAAFPAALVTLILSDVVGDDLDVIASGPTVPDASTFDDCWAVVERYGLETRLPKNIIRHLRNGAARQIEDTPKQESVDWRRVDNLIVGSNFQAMAAAARKAKFMGYSPLILSSGLEGETREVAKVHGAIAREVIARDHPLPPPACILSGGETTVTLKGKGTGGRNQEFVLAAAAGIAGSTPVVVLSAGSDGSDGPTDAAGAVADHTTIQRAADLGLNSRAYLDNNDAYPFFHRLGDLVITGPTGTNVMDIRIMLIGAGQPHKEMETA